MKNFIHTFLLVLTLFVTSPALAANNAVASVAAAQTDSSLITAVAGHRIRVVGIVIQAGGTATLVTLNTKGAGAGTAISPAFSLGINGSLQLPLNNDGWFETKLGEALTVTTGAGATTGFLVLYKVIGN